MKTLVVYYSRTGNTKAVAEKIAHILKADIEEIIDKKKRSGILGWLKGGRDAFMRKSTEIESEKDPSKYELVVIGTPVWAGTMVPAVRTYLTENKLNKVAFFCTFGGNEAKTFKEMEELTKKPIAVLGLKEKSLDVNEFCRKLIP